MLVCMVCSSTSKQTMIDESSEIKSEANENEKNLWSKTFSSHFSVTGLASKPFSPSRAASFLAEPLWLAQFPSGHRKERHCLFPQRILWIADRICGLDIFLSKSVEKISSANFVSFLAFFSDLSLSLWVRISIPFLYLCLPLVKSFPLAFFRPFQSCPSIRHSLSCAQWPSSSHVFQTLLRFTPLPDRMYFLQSVIWFSILVENEFPVSLINLLSLAYFLLSTSFGFAVIFLNALTLTSSSKQILNFQPEFCFTNFMSMLSLSFLGSWSASKTDLVICSALLSVWAATSIDVFYFLLISATCFALICIWAFFSHSLCVRFAIRMLRMLLHTAFAKIAFSTKTEAFCCLFCFSSLCAKLIKWYWAKTVKLFRNFCIFLSLSPPAVKNMSLQRNQLSGSVRHWVFCH